MPELVARNAPLDLLIDFAPLLSDLGDELPCMGLTFQLLGLGVAVDHGGNQDRDEEDDEEEVEVGKEYDGSKGGATTILAVLLELFIGGNLEADEVGLGCLHRIPDLLDRCFRDREFEQGKQSREEVLVALINTIDFLVGAQEAEKLHSHDCKNEERSCDHEQDKASARQDDGESLEDLLSEGDLVEH